MLNFYEFMEQLHQQDTKTPQQKREAVYYLAQGMIQSEVMPKIEQMFQQWASTQKDFYPAPTLDDFHIAMYMAIENVLNKK
jgi:hypothetical protein